MKKTSTVRVNGTMIFKGHKLTIGLDLGDRWSFYCVLDEAGPRGAQQPRGHAGGTRFALLHAGEGARQGHGYRGVRPEPTRARTPSDVAALADLVPRVGDGPAQKLHDGSNENTNGLLRQYLPRTRICPATPVGPGRDRSASESTATKDVGISNSGG
jgi:hypothetical protein